MSGNFKILIIDDNKDDRDIMQRYLTRAGFNHLHFAETGEDGVASAASIKPDLVIVDTLLPKMDGFETCKTIKGIDGIATKVIIVTGNIDAVDAGTARSVGADDYCVKTSTYDPVIRAIQTLLGLDK